MLNSVNQEKHQREPDPIDNLVPASPQLTADCGPDDRADDNVDPSMVYVSKPACLSSKGETVTVEQRLWILYLDFWRFGMRSSNLNSGINLRSRNHSIFFLMVTMEEE